MNTHNQVQFWTIDHNYAGQRIDNFLIARLKGVPKSRIYRIIRKGEVRVNKGRIKATYKLREHDLVRIPPIRIAEKKPTPAISNLNQVKQLEDCILLETNQYLLLNKPSGIAVHGGSGLSFGVIEALRSLRPQEKFLELVHRIDRDTSGCLLIAKRRTYLNHFQNQLRHRKMKKEYVALLSGKVDKQNIHVDQPLLREERKSGERVVKVDKQGKPSETKFKIIETFNHHTLISAKPMTGRTHQIRVHAKYIGHPLLGDEKYNQNKQAEKFAKELNLNSFLLHAHKLTYTLPDSEERVTAEAPLPVAFEDILEKLRKTSERVK